MGAVEIKEMAEGERRGEDVADADPAGKKRKKEEKRRAHRS